MIQMNEISNELQNTFASEQYSTLAKAFNYVNNMYTEQNKIIGLIKDDFDDYKKGDAERKTEIKKDLLVELATKADIEKLNGRITSEIEKLNGRITSEIEKLNGRITSEIEKLNGRITFEIEKLNGKIDKLELKITGEFKNIRIWLKMFIAVAIFGIACFSPNIQTLLRMLKF